MHALIASSTGKGNFSQPQTNLIFSRTFQIQHSQPEVCASSAILPGDFPAVPAHETSTLKRDSPGEPVKQNPHCHKN
jgi:hypothetical protein